MTMATVFKKDVRTPAKCSKTVHGAFRPKQGERPWPLSTITPVAFAAGDDPGPPQHGHQATHDGE